MFFCFKCIRPSLSKIKIKNKKFITSYSPITKKIILFFFMHKTKTFKKGFSMHFGFNNKFVRAMRT